jgi:two-component system chemotaxis response regulator CheB
MNDKKVIVIGGSAGCLPVIIAILKELPRSFRVPLVLVLHRQRNVVSELKRILNVFHDKQIIEPDDKDPVSDCCIYLAPQNYHLLFEPDHTFSLDYSEVVRYSRPSIDVTFESAAIIFGAGATGIVLSGANNDGAAGLQTIIENRGTAIVQDPDTAEYPIMPRAAIELNKDVRVMNTTAISEYLKSLSH